MRQGTLTITLYRIVYWARLFINYNKLPESRLTKISQVYLPQVLPTGQYTTGNQSYCRCSQPTKIPQVYSPQVFPEAPLTKIPQVYLPQELPTDYIPQVTNHIAGAPNRLRYRRYTYHRYSRLTKIPQVYLIHFIGQKPKGHAGPKTLTRAHVHSNVCTCMSIQLWACKEHEHVKNLPQVLHFHRAFFVLNQSDRHQVWSETI